MRLATEADIPALVELGKRFHEESGYSEVAEYDPHSVSLCMHGLINGMGFLLMDDDSMCGVVVFPAFFNSKVKLAQELFWFVAPEKRKSGIGAALLKRAEEGAKEMGASAIFMLCLESVNPEMVSKFYLANGYEVRERHFMKVL